MNKYPALSVTLALVAGLVLANASLGESYAYTNAEKTLYGHFTLVVKDDYGNIRDYIEVDNTITDEGDGCIGNLAFAATGASCSGGVIDAISVSNCDAAGSGDSGNADCATIADTTTQFDDTENADVGDECDTTGEGGFSSTYTARVGATPAKVRITSTFDTAEIDSDGLVKQAGILNGCAAGDQLFAIKAFATVTLAGSDTLTVNYDVSFSG
jgi:hypothetical protein